ncbi:MAG: hypothetical protein HYZ68_03600 [Chloroflexi bacterium]|nr:hypothetical protein [Chloroflexota bacterium]
MPFIIQKVSNEGTREPFIARLFFGVLDLRDQVLGLRSRDAKFIAERDRFDQLYEPVWNALTNARGATKELCRIVLEHEEKLASGYIIRSQTEAVEISESVDTPVRAKFVELLT